ncbi:MAG: hypothetical protein ACREYC_21335 [Gammaproteobacteria bacterium]
MTTPIIKTATAADEAPVIDVVVLAFSADPAARWTWRDPHLTVMYVETRQLPRPDPNPWSE